MKKVLLSLVALTLVFNTINAEETEVLNDEATTNVLTSEVKTTITTIEELEKAILAAKDGDTIKLDGNIIGSIIIDKNITLDLNGYSISAEGNKTIIVIKDTKKVTIKNGSIKNADTKSQNGAMNIDTKGEVIIDNITFNNNKSMTGSSIKTNGGNITIKNSLFENNEAASTGGAIQVSATFAKVNLVIENTTFKNNQSQFGGAIDFSSTNPNNRAILTLKENVKFIKNSAKSYGGAVRITGSNTEAHIENTLFDGNHASSGGALHIANGVLDNETMKIKNSKFINNDALTGGAIYITPSSIKVNGVLPELVNEIIELDEKTIITDNKANAGAGVYVVAGPNSVKLTLKVKGDIYRNTAKNMADDIYVAGKTKNNHELILSNVNENNKLDCDHTLDGWYIDAKNARWNAHDMDKLNTEKVNSLELTGAQTLKAAHNAFGKVIIKYVDKKGNILAENKTITGKVNTKYETKALEFEDYSLVDTIGNENGEFTKEVIEVTYVYEFTSGMGGDDVPETGITSTNALEITTVLSIITLVTTIILRKRFN